MSSYIQILSRFFHYKHIETLMVKRLYILSQKSIIALLIFSFILVYTLYPSIGDSLLFWEGGLILLSLLRLYLAYIYQKYSKKLSLLTWYKIFVFLALSTATFFSLIGSFYLFYLDDIKQVFVVATLVGMTGGAMSSLFPDIRIVIGYISVILIPLIFSLFFIDSSLSIVLVLLVSIYFIAQMIIFFNTYQQNNVLEAEKEILHAEQIALLKKEETLNYFFDEAPIGIFAYDKDLNIADCNRAFLNLFQLNKEQIIGKNLNDLPDKRPIDTIKNALTKGTQVYRGPYTSIQEINFWVEAKCFPVTHNNNDIAAIGLIENKTKEHSAVKDLKYLAQHDPLTSLLNRRGLKDYMMDFMKKKEHQNMCSLLVYLDLNKFKHINDSLGHKAGDKLLISIANRLKVSIKKSCLVSRFGGDEFIVVSPFVAKNKKETKVASKECISRIQKAFVTAFNIDDMQLSISTSLGIVIIEPNTFNIDEIIRYADIAMYQAKKSTLDHTSYYNTHLDAERKKLFMLQHDLGHAAKKEEISFYLQPLVNIKNETLVAAEVLLRWDHPTLGHLSPTEFIPMAIETGLISDITWWLIDKVCHYISTLKQDHLWNLKYLSININAKQLLLNHFVDDFIVILETYNLDKSDIMIEITERSIIDNFEDTQDVINELREQGIKCAIDDFGIGYSSLSYLKKLSFDTLKIDMEFIREIETRPDDIALVKTIIAIAKQFDYHIVVEGIEKEKQKELLLEIDKDLIYQGFLFSKPIPKDVFTQRFLKAKN